MVVVRHIPVILVLILLVGCAGPNDAALESDQARLFTALHGGEVVSATTAFDTNDAIAFGDLARAECPADLPAEFSRTVLSADDSTLVIYTDEDDVIVCSVFKPAAASEIVARAPAEAPAPDVAVTVNGDVITYAEIQAALDQLPNAQQESIAGVVNGIVNTLLIAQAARDIEVTDEEIVAASEQILAELGGSGQTADEILANAGYDDAWLSGEAIAAAQIKKLLTARLLLDEVEFTESDAQAAYLADPNQFVQGEQAVARVLLVASDGRSSAQAEARANEIAARIPNEDFCALVTEYSDDERSRELCGVYILPRGVIDTRLETAAFTTPANQTAVVLTDAGIYFVQTMQVLPASVVPYADVAQQLQDAMRTTEAQARLALYVDVLRSQAMIVSYLG